MNQDRCSINNNLNNQLIALKYLRKPYLNVDKFSYVSGETSDLPWMITDSDRDHFSVYMHHLISFHKSILPGDYELTRIQKHSELLC